MDQLRSKFHRLTVRGGVTVAVRHCLLFGIHQSCMHMFYQVIVLILNLKVNA